VNPVGVEVGAVELVEVVVVEVNVDETELDEADEELEGDMVPADANLSMFF